MIGIGLGLTDAAANGGGPAAPSWTPDSLTNPLGAWEPFDLTSMYTFGTLSGTSSYWGQRCTAVSDDVGFVLDKSQMDYSTYANAGAWVDDLLATSPNFDEDMSSSTGWTFDDGTVTITGGQLVFTSSPANIDAYKNWTTAPSIGDWVYIEIVVDSVTSGSIQINGGISATQNITAAGTYYTIQYMQFSTSSLFVRPKTAGTTAAISSIKAVVIPGNHLHARSSGNYGTVVQRAGGTYACHFAGGDWITTSSVFGTHGLTSFAMAIDTIPDAGTPDYRQGLMTLDFGTDNPGIGHGIGTGTGAWQHGIRDDYTVEYTTGTDDSATRATLEAVFRSTTFDFKIDGSAVATGTAWSASPLTITNVNAVNIGTEYTQSSIYDYDGDFACAYLYDGASGIDTNLNTYITTNVGA